MEETTRSGLMRTSDVVAYIGVSRVTLYRMRRRGKFPPPCQVTSGLSLWRRQDVESFVDELCALDPVSPPKFTRQKSKGPRGKAGKSSPSTPEQGRLL